MTSVVPVQVRPRAPNPFSLNAKIKKLRITELFFRPYLSFLAFESSLVLVKSWRACRDGSRILFSAPIN